MSIKALQEYTRFAKYARHLPEESRRETWDEQVDRVFEMHVEKFGEDVIAQIQDDFDHAKKMVKQKRVLGSQRALQFGGPPILKKNARMYNCTSSYVDRPRFFQECMFLLLCGCGTGFSVQKHHVAELPPISDRTKGSKIFTPEDSIEGWANCVGVLMSSYFEGKVPFPQYQGYNVEFDFSKIRPAGSPVSSGSKAPGPNGLRRSLEEIEKLMDRVIRHGQDRLHPVDAYDVIMHASDAVLSGGIRRSATICLFSADDAEMATAKTGAWRMENPQRGRSNNSAILIRDDTSKEQFDQLMHSVKEFGEPGFVWADNRELLVNPCVEIGLYGHLHLNKALREELAEDVAMQDNDKVISGWDFCNLSEINVKKATTEEEFYDACRAAALIGTLQAAYTSFPYLGRTSELIVEKEALLGVSMTGMADNPDVAFDPKVQRRGAKIVLETNERIAQTIGINPCARATCIKPAGTSSSVLGTASGIHPHHAKRYFRRVQANKLETPLQYFWQFNPRAIEESVWSNNNTDVIISFLCEVPDGAKTKNQVDALTLLENVKLTQQNWVMHGTRKEACVQPWLIHNVSNTINIKPDEWGDVASFIYRNKKWLAGISMVPQSGDKDYPQSPFTAVYTPNEIVREYGDASIFASGLIEGGLRAFEENLWAACDCVLGIGEPVSVSALRSKMARDFEHNGEHWKQQNLSLETSDKDLEAWLRINVKMFEEKVEWIRRAKQFAERYFDEDVRKMTYCLKDVMNWKMWCDLSREYVDVDWTQCHEDMDGNLVETDFIGEAGDACAGGACELGDLGAAIAESKALEMSAK